jgi:hypothetical protein
MLVQFGVPSSFRTLSVGRVSPSLVPRTVAFTFSAMDTKGLSRDTLWRGQMAHGFSTISSKFAMVGGVNSVRWGTDKERWGEERRRRTVGDWPVTTQMHSQMPPVFAVKAPGALVNLPAPA